MFILCKFTRIITKQDTFVIYKLKKKHISICIIVISEICVQCQRKFKLIYVQVLKYLQALDMLNT